MVMYALILALFFPLAALFSQLDSHTQILEQAKLQGTVYYVDQMRMALAHYREDNPNANQEVTAGELFNLHLLPSTLKDSPRGDIKQYIDEHGFYIVWERDDASNKKPPVGLANALVNHYSRATGQPIKVGGVERPYQLAFYHVGFADQAQCLITTRAYLPITSPHPSCLYPLPPIIKEGSLVLTDRQAAH